MQSSNAWADRKTAIARSHLYADESPVNDILQQPKKNGIFAAQK